MKRTSGPHAFRAGPVLVLATFVASVALAFAPTGPAAVVAVDVTPAPTIGDPTASSAPSPLTDPAPSPDPTPTVEPSPDVSTGASPGPSAAAAASASADPVPSPSPTPAPTLSPTHEPSVLLQTSTAPATGRHRVDPTTSVGFTLNLALGSDVKAGKLVEYLPTGWVISDPGEGSWNPDEATVSWNVDGSAGDQISEHFLAIAPSLPLPDGARSLTSTFTTSFADGTEVVSGTALTVLVAPMAVIGHVTLGQIPEPAVEPVYAATDSPIIGEPHLEAFRVRFDVSNADNIPVDLVPTLVYRPAADTEMRRVPERPGEGEPFGAAEEWIAAMGGTVPGPTSELIAAGSLLPTETGLSNTVAVDGRRSMGLNPLPSFSLAGDAHTAIEFSVRATGNAPFLTSFAFALGDGGQVIPAGAEGIVLLGSGEVELSPGQRSGLSVAGSRWSPVYRLRALAAEPLGPPNPNAVHGPYSLTSDACAACHGAHSAQTATYLGVVSGAQFSLCVRCHDGSQASIGGVDITQDYSTAIANDATTRSYYQHDPTTGVSYHLSAANERFIDADQRHAECADCHQPHRASDATSATETSSGWTASSRLDGAEGVQPSNPTDVTGGTYEYTLIPSITSEFQLCLKCHSGYAAQLPNDPAHPSRDRLDAAVEFNPNSLSFHPIEAVGTNDTTAMTNSLAGTSPYKLWNLTTSSTIRCSNCHADSGKVAQTPGDFTTGSGTPPQDAALPLHASQNRGILLLPYRDRVLKSAVEPYAPADFALCFACHAEAPFDDSSGQTRADTNFSYHGFHIRKLAGYGTGGTDIDVAGAGSGRAICAECHFRIHSSALPVPGQSLDGQTATGGSRIVNFAPDVTPELNLDAGTYVGISWTRRDGTIAGTCTLTCHGAPHGSDRSRYRY